ncbi:MAG: HVA1 family protein [Phycisphaerales bacterium]
MHDRINKPSEVHTAGARASNGPCTDGADGRSLSIWTIGHSTRTSGEFIDLLHQFRISALVDVRHFPGSRRFPHFHESALRRSLTNSGTQYEHLVELGGRRPVRPDSHNIAWRNASFRGYADYMETPPFRAGVDRLLEIARSSRTAIMCSEAVWWRCHRSMIGDYLKVMGVRVLHILGPTQLQEHPYTSAARLVNGQLSYAGPLLDPPRESTGGPPMTHAFKVGDHVEWNSEAGRVRGTIKKIVRSPIKFKGYTVRASKEEPQYLIKSDTTDHLAMHKGAALRMVREARPVVGSRAR